MSREKVEQTQQIKVTLLNKIGGGIAGLPLGFINGQMVGVNLMIEWPISNIFDEEKPLAKRVPETILMTVFVSPAISVFSILGNTWKAAKIGSQHGAAEIPSQLALTRLPWTTLFSPTHESRIARTEAAAEDCYIPFL